MTLTDSADGDDHDYADIADSITDVGDRVDADLAELYRRAVLNCAIHNTDDHLRNHGFIASATGWKLSPVFDVNPNPDLNEDRVTSIGTATRADEEPAGLLAFAEQCRLTRSRANEIIQQVLAATADWADLAAGNSIRNSELTLFRAMFDDRSAALRKLAATNPLPTRTARQAIPSPQGRVPRGTPAGGRFTGKQGSPPATSL